MTTKFSPYMTVNDVQGLLHISQSGAYKVIQELNRELEQQGFLTVRGKVPSRYLMKRYGLTDDGALQHGGNTGS